MTAPDKIFIAYPSEPPPTNWTDYVHTPAPEHVKYIRDDLHQSALAERDREIAELRLQIKGYEEWAEDIKRLTRKLDVEMHGEENAAKQASLCDLIGSGKELRDQIDRLQARLKACPTVKDMQDWLDGIEPSRRELREFIDRMEALNDR